MSQIELHELERARAHQTGRGPSAATIAEVALVLLLVGVWWVTCLAG